MTHCYSDQGWNAEECTPVLLGGKRLDGTTAYPSGPVQSDCPTPSTFPTDDGIGLECGQCSRLSRARTESTGGLNDRDEAASLASKSPTQQSYEENYRGHWHLTPFPEAQSSHDENHWSAATTLRSILGLFIVMIEWITLISQGIVLSFRNAVDRALTTYSCLHRAEKSPEALRQSPSKTKCFFVERLVNMDLRSISVHAAERIQAATTNVLSSMPQFSWDCKPDLHRTLQQQLVIVATLPYRFGQATKRVRHLFERGINVARVVLAVLCIECASTFAEIDSDGRVELVEPYVLWIARAQLIAENCISTFFRSVRRKIKCLLKRKDDIRFYANSHFDCSGPCSREHATLHGGSSLLGSKFPTASVVFNRRSRSTPDSAPVARSYDKSVEETSRSIYASDCGLHYPSIAAASSKSTQPCSSSTFVAQQFFNGIPYDRDLDIGKVIRHTLGKCRFVVDAGWAVLSNIQGVFAFCYETMIDYCAGWMRELNGSPLCGLRRRRALRATANGIIG